MRAYHLYGKPSNPGENSNGTVHPSGNCPEKRNTLRGITFFPFLPKRPKCLLLFVWLPVPVLLLRRKVKNAVFSQEGYGVLQMVQL